MCNGHVYPTSHTTIFRFELLPWYARIATQRIFFGIRYCSFLLTEVPQMNPGLV